MPQASLPESPLGPANPAEDRITLLNLPTGRHGPHLTCQPKMMVLLPLSALRGFLSSLMPTRFLGALLALQMSFSWFGKGFELLAGQVP